ncbi:Uncharacterized protein SVXHr_1159 [Halorhabdus sp. SVX81]|uniref:hypothetical protein n=1 Tax=Halorhabdus sp. SVX81 TaxID=2978283 RepID=UPI0023DCE078|nr:hypothetical protein [Halorhabdus sp. SVX81]WEL17333.1 Uncharacterized protein SVXHr_1159 [Halorhabdus sp. SVX81]
MIDQRIVEKAETLAKMAPDDSVTAEVLAGREGRFSTTTPLAAPPVTYLQDTEAPAYVLTNKKRGIGLGSKRNTTSPTGERRTVILVTGRRTLCLVGGESDDEVIEIPHESVAKAAYSTGLRANRIALRTPRQQYHCWIHRKTTEALLDATTEFIEERQPEDPEPTDGDDASRVMYRGRPVNRDQLTGSSGESDSDRTVTYRGKPVEDS